VTERALDLPVPGGGRAGENGLRGAGGVGHDGAFRLDGARTAR
jgi:hypothetical protein